jgi:hypothetical protein
VPTLLHGAGTWTEIKPATEKKLNSLQQWFARLVLQVGPGAPLAALGWELGLVNMKLRVWREKIALVLHLRSLGTETLAGQIYQEQLTMDLPGLAKETQSICSQLGIEDCNRTDQNKDQYKNVLNDAIKRKDEEILRGQAENKSKCERILQDKYGKKYYTTKEKIGDVRKWFRTRVRLLPFAGNYPGDRQYARTEWMCRCEGEREVESHLVSGDCPVYGDIKEKFINLEDDNELVAFFREVLERRDLIDEINKEEEEYEEEEEEDLEEEEDVERRQGPGGDLTPLMLASPSGKLV